LGPQAGLGYLGDQYTLDELGVLLGQPRLVDQEVVEVGADRRRSLAGHERLQAVEHLGHHPRALTLEEIEEDRVAVGEKPLLVVGGLLDRDTQEVGVLPELLLRARIEVDGALPARPPRPRRDPPLGALVQGRSLDDLRRAVVLGRRGGRGNLLLYGRRRRRKGTIDFKAG